MSDGAWLWLLCVVVVAEFLVILVLWHQNHYLRNRLNWSKKRFEEQADELQGLMDLFDSEVSLGPER